MLRSQEGIKRKGQCLAIEVAFKVQKPGFYGGMMAANGGPVANIGHRKIGVALHGSLASDMDIMAMPWVSNACSFRELTIRIVALFTGNSMSESFTITYNEKPHGRIVATIPIWADFYLDISAIQTTGTRRVR